MVSMPRRVTIFVPAFNEAFNIEPAVRDAVDAASGLDDFEILIVDDGSTDGTSEIADRLARELPRVRVIHHPHNQGIGATYRTALDAARMEYITWTGGDGELPRESLREILNAVGSASVLVPYYGNPDPRPFYRKILTWVSTQQVNLMFGFRLRYYQGPAVMPTQVARNQPPLTNGFYFATERVVYALSDGNSWREVPFHAANRATGQSKAVSFRNVLRAERVIWRLWWNVRVRGSRRAVSGVSPQPSTLLEGSD
jgi:glycosyltransferase involved in cell wall biosynthesis